jgi:hypothetical protein
MVLAQPPVKRDILTNIDAFTFLESVPLSQMFVAPYGRAVSRSTLGRMHRSGFSERKLGIITLSMRPDGRYAILDGNHRRHLCHGLGLTHMLARVFIDLTYEDEAELFEALNTMSVPTALERFNSRLEYNDPTAMDIRRMLLDHDLDVARTSGKPPRGKLSCIGALEALYTERGAQEFAEVINVIYAAWDDDPQAWVGHVIAGFRQFWARYRNQVEFKRLVEQLRTRTPGQILAAAGAYAGMAEPIGTRVGKCLVTVYNGKSRSAKLSEWPARTKSESSPRADAVRKGSKIVDRLKSERGTQERHR